MGLVPSGLQAVLWLRTSLIDHRVYILQNKLSIYVIILAELSRKFTNLIVFTKKAEKCNQRLKLYNR